MCQTLLQRRCVMYAFALELKPKVIRGELRQSWSFRIEEDYRNRLPNTHIQVLELPNNVFRVQFADKDYNFNWCFSVPDDFTLVAFEITMEDIVMPSTSLGVLDATSCWRVFPNPIDFSGLFCEMTINSAKRWVKVRTTLSDQYHWNNYRRGMMEVVQGVINIARMTKWVNRMAKGYSENNLGLAYRAQLELLKAISNSTPFFVTR